MKTKLLLTFITNRLRFSKNCKTIKFACIVFLFSVFTFVSCKRDESFLTDSSAKLEFSNQSVLFDTIFTQIGSVTKQFKIYNRHNKPLKISSIQLTGNTSSYFRMNVDGVSTRSIQNIEIAKKDSLFIFIEVTIDPNKTNNPLIISDSVLFEVNGNKQYVTLEAWGQNAVFHVPTEFPTNGAPAYSIIACNEVWKNNIPHVIYGYAIVDANCKLTIEEGTKIYMHKGAILWVYNAGTLEVKGSPSNPVIIQGDRLEAEYNEISGQWGKIWLSAGSKNNTVDWAIIKNGSIGLQADTLGNSLNPTLKVSNSIIKNMSVASLFGQGSYIQSYNCVFANAEQYVAALTLGGRYSFRQCTFANYWIGSRTNPLLLLNNWYTDVNGKIQIRGIDSAYFGNCIIYGNLINEIELDSTKYGGNFRFMFDHSLLKTNLKTNNTYHYNSSIANADPLFLDYSNNNYNLNSQSNAINKGDVSIGNSYSIDLNNLPRNIDALPDLGAYEYKQ